MEPIRERTPFKQPEHNGTLVDLPKLRGRLCELSAIIAAIKRQCCKPQHAVKPARTDALGRKYKAEYASVDWSQLYALKAEATALCMLRAAVRGKRHPIDAGDQLRRAVAFATGVTVQSISRGLKFSEERAHEYADLAIERMAEKYVKSSPMSRASSAA